MSDDGGAAGALAAAVMAALRGVAGLSQVSDGAPIQAGDAHAVVEMGPETDWGFKEGAGAELRFAVRVACAGERPERARLLLERVRVAVAPLGPQLGGWRLVTLSLVRARVVQAAGPRWTCVADYRARMLRG
jgi:hypothetical protein